MVCWHILLFRLFFLSNIWYLCLNCKHLFSVQNSFCCYFYYYALSIVYICEILPKYYIILYSTCISNSLRQWDIKCSVTVKDVKTMVRYCDLSFNLYFFIWINVPETHLHTWCINLNTWNRSNYHTITFPNVNVSVFNLIARFSMLQCYICFILSMATTSNRIKRVNKYF